tara:strand:- start:67 stop:3534 length:3468 start_codon:yes stop_codon:yes gene_type:complete
MDVCDPDVKTKNIRKLIKLHTGRKMQIPKDRMCEIMRDISRGNLPLPPLVLTRDKRYLLDPKSPLTKRDYESLYKSRVTSRVVKRIAKKVGLIETDKTIVDLKRSIGRRLASMNVYEPILLPGSRVVLKVKNGYSNEENVNGELNNERNDRNVNNEFRNEENVNGELNNEQREKPSSLRNMLARKRQKSRLKFLTGDKTNVKTNTERDDRPNANNERRRMEINAKQRIETVKRNANKRIENSKRYAETKLSESRILNRRRKQRQFAVTNNALRREQRDTQRAELNAGMARINRSQARFKATINAKRSTNLEKSLNNMKRSSNEATKKMNVALRKANIIQKRMNNGEKLALKRISSLETTIKETQTQRDSLEARVSELQKKIGSADNKGDTTERNRLQLELNVATKKIAELSKSQTQKVTKLDEEVKKAKNNANNAEMKRTALKNARNREEEASRQKKAIENKLANNKLAANERKKLQNERNAANKAKKNAENERAKLVLKQFEAQKNKNRKNAAARLIQGFVRKKATKRNENIAAASKKLTNNAIKKAISDEKEDAERKRIALKDARNKEDEALRQKKAIENKLANNKLAANERKKLQNERNAANKAKKNAENERAKLVLKQFEAQKNKNRKNAAARRIQDFVRKKATKRNENIATASKKLTNNAIKKVISGEGKPTVALPTKVSLSKREINTFQQKLLNAEKAKRIHPFNARRYKTFIATSETLNNTTKPSGFKIMGKIEPVPSSRRTARMRNIETADRRLNKRVLKGPSRNALKSKEHMALNGANQKKFTELRNSKKSERKELKKRMNMDGASINTSNDNSTRSTIYSNASSDKKTIPAMRLGGRAAEKPYPINPLFVARKNENIEAAGAQFMGGATRNNPLAPTDNDRTKAATKIQAGFRGVRNRGKVKRLKANKDATNQVAKRVNASRLLQIPPRRNVTAKLGQMSKEREKLIERIKKAEGMKQSLKDIYIKRLKATTPEGAYKNPYSNIKTEVDAIMTANARIARVSPVSTSNVKIELKRAPVPPPGNKPLSGRFKAIGRAQIQPKKPGMSSEVLRRGVKAAVAQKNREVLTTKVRQGTDNVERNQLRRARLVAATRKEEAAKARLAISALKKSQKNKKNIRKAAEGSRNAAVGFVARRKASLQTTNAPK